MYRTLWTIFNKGLNYFFSERYGSGNDVVTVQRLFLSYALETSFSKQMN